MRVTLSTEFSIYLYVWICIHMAHVSYTNCAGETKPFNSVIQSQETVPHLQANG